MPSINSALYAQPIIQTESHESPSFLRKVHRLDPPDYQSINQSIFYSISDTYSVIHIIHSKFTINKKQRRGEKDMFEAIQLISNII